MDTEQSDLLMQVSMTVAETLQAAIAARDYLETKRKVAHELYTSVNDVNSWRYSYNRGMVWGLQLAVNELDSLIARLES